MLDTFVEIYRAGRWNALTAGSPDVGANMAITAAGVDGANGTYGVNDVVTDTGGVVHFWLKQNSDTTASVSVEVNSHTYAEAWARIGTSETKTLLKPSFSVAFDSNGGTLVDREIVAFGGTVTKPSDPTRTGYTFDGWYTDSTPNTAWDFTADTVSGDMTLYAKWTDTTPPTGEIEIRNNSFTEFLDNITFGLFFKNMVDVEISGKDDETGVDTIEYIKTDTMITDFSTASWTAYEKMSNISAAKSSGTLIDLPLCAV